MGRASRGVWRCRVSRRNELPASESQARDRGEKTQHSCCRCRLIAVARRKRRKERVPGTIAASACRSVDPDQFSQALDQGINIARGANADVVLVNAQYSPRTESMIALSTYSEDMRWVALQQEVPLFDRFSIMRLWSDLGTFDLYSATKKLDIAERVHDCIGRLLADLVIAAAKPPEPPTNGSR